MEMTTGNTNNSTQNAIDNDHLKLLSIFHYIQGGFTALFAFLPLMYAFMGGLIFFIEPSLEDSAEQVPQAIGWFLIAFGVLASLFIALIAALRIYAGRSISQRRKYVICLIIAGFNCFCMPYGTALGVCTFMVLMRPTVKKQFSSNQLINNPQYEAQETS